MAKILVAEDDPSTRKLMGAMLKRAGFDVALACDGDETLDVFLGVHSDLSKGWRMLRPSI